MDDLEKFILENRAQFDTEIPSLRVWGGIDRQLQQKPAAGRVVWLKRLQVAAAAAFLVAAGSTLSIYLANSAREVKSLGDISQEYAEMEYFFNNQVTEKMAQLADYRQDSFVKTDIQELDARYEQLKEELREAPPGTEEKIIQAMIKNYQTKIDILEQVLEKVKTTNSANSKTTGNEISI